MQGATIILLIFSVVIFSASAADQKIPANLLQEDFKIMQRALEEGHGGIHRYTTKAEMNRVFDRAYRQINRPMSGLEFYRLITPVVARIKCGHTGTWWPKSVQTQLREAVSLLPVELTVLNGRLYVLRDYSDSAPELRGKEIVSINGVPAKRIIKITATVFHGDGNSAAAVPRHIGSHDFFNPLLYALLGIEGPFRVVYQETRGKRLEAQLTGVPWQVLDDYSMARLSSSSTNADLKFLHDGRTAVLTIRSFDKHVVSNRGKTLQAFFQNAFERIAEEGSDNLIIDLRNNRGGQDELGRLLFSYLWNEPFQYYEDLVINAREFEFFRYVSDAKPVPANLVERWMDGKFHFVKHPNWGLQQPSHPQFPGKVFALINGGTFSTSCEFLSILHFHRRATFIGEETAGTYYGNSSGFTANLTLPHSGVAVWIPLTTYQLAVSGYKHRDRGLFPNHRVEYSISDVLSGKDRDMEQALALAEADKLR